MPKKKPIYAEDNTTIIGWEIIRKKPKKKKPKEQPKSVIHETTPV